MAKMALVVGCNYPETEDELSGCINDVNGIIRMLIDIYGFLEEDIIVLVDDGPDSLIQPTGTNIRLVLSLLVKSAKAGDILFIHYSGHGFRFPAKNSEEDDTGFHECIVPSDFNLITDNEFRKIVDELPKDCKITIVSDCCHSGTLIEGAKEQIGQSTKKQHSWFGFMSKIFMFNTDPVEPHGFHGDYKNRSLPVSSLIDILKLKTGKDDIDEGNLIPTLFDMFGEHASPEVKNYMKFGLDGPQHEGGESGGHTEILRMVEKQDAYVRSMNSSFPDRGIQLSACQSDQSAKEPRYHFTTSDKVYGFFSKAILDIIQETDGRIANWELVLKARKKLELDFLTQKPGLYCSDYDVGAPFVCDLIETQSLCKQVIDLTKEASKKEEVVTGLQDEVGKLQEENEGLKAEIEDIKLQWERSINESFANALEQLKVLNPGLCTDGTGSTIVWRMVLSLM